MAGGGQIQQEIGAAEVHGAVDGMGPEEGRGRYCSRQRSPQAFSQDQGTGRLHQPIQIGQAAERVTMHVMQHEITHASAYPRQLQALSAHTQRLPDERLDRQVLHLQALQRGPPAIRPHHIASPLHALTMSRLMFA